MSTMRTITGNSVLVFVAILLIVAALGYAAASHRDMRPAAEEAVDGAY